MDLVSLKTSGKCSWNLHLINLIFEFKASYIYSWSRFSTHVPTAVFSGVRILHVMLGVAVHINLLQ